MDPVPLPDDIVKRFDNVMLPIIGYEVDQVRSFFFSIYFSPECIVQTMVDSNGNEVSVPINHQYNHHYIAYLNGKKSKLVKMHQGAVQFAGAKYFNHNPEDLWISIATDPKAVALNIPTSQMFSEANGGTTLATPIRNIYYTLTPHYTLHTTHYTLHTTHYTLHTTHYTLHTTYYTFSLHVSTHF